MYRNRASVMRNLASMTHDGLSTQLLLEIAADYDRIAETQERITGMESIVRKRLSRICPIEEQ